MKKIWFATAIAAALLAVGVGVWFSAGEDLAAPGESRLALSARETLARHLAEGRGVAAADWIRGGQIGEGGEAGNHARFQVLGQGGREATAYLVRLGDAAWYLVSLTEGPPQCAAVERYGFPSAMIADCRVGEAQTVAEALAAAIAGGDVSGVRLVGQISLPPDPSCNCVLLSSGGASVRLNISAADLAAAGIGVGDTVVISGGLGDDLSVDATAVIRADEDGTPKSVPPRRDDGPSGEDEGGGSGDTGRPRQTTPAPEPVGQKPGGGGGPSGTIKNVPSFPNWKPRIRYVTSWYASPLDLDSSAATVPTLGE